MRDELNSTKLIGIVGVVGVALPTVGSALFAPTWDFPGTGRHGGRDHGLRRRAPGCAACGSPPQRHRRDALGAVRRRRLATPTPRRGELPICLFSLRGRLLRHAAPRGFRVLLGAHIPGPADFRCAAAVRHGVRIACHVRSAHRGGAGLIRMAHLSVPTPPGMDGGTRGRRRGRPSPPACVVSWSATASSRSRGRSSLSSRQRSSSGSSGQLSRCCATHLRKVRARRRPTAKRVPRTAEEVANEGHGRRSCFRVI